ncbi:MAG: hypothetical protein EOP83_31355, partial [Verrucomicrobiaceae bacterium]
MKNRKFHPFAALAVLAATTAAASAGPGNIDKAFGSSGKVTANYGGTDSANAVAVQADGKIVVAGVTTTMGNIDVAVVRYKPNGSLDTSFDFDGGVITDLGSATTDTVKAVAIQKDGKILVAGGNGTNSVVVRYLPNGQLDTFFGSGGKLNIDAPSTDEAVALHILSDGTFYVAGSCYLLSTTDFYITRRNKDGTPDTTFNSGSITTFTFGDVDVCTSMAVQPDGKIVLAGYSNDVTTNDFAVARLTTAGILDTTFDGDGKLLTNFGSDDRAKGVVVQKDGKIVAAGSWDGGASDFAIARYNTDGSLDTTFSGDGKANAAFIASGAGGTEFANAMALQKDGRILVAGYTNYTEAANDFGIMRFNTDGTLDTS